MIHIESDVVRFDAHFVVSFQRTLRVPDDGRRYPLPPGLGTLPIFSVEQYAERLPAEWRKRGGIFIPMYQREALWLGFRSTWQHPRALKVSVGGYNVLSGEPDQPGLKQAPQDYLVCPPQVWLDGVRTERGSVRQFVAVPLGQGKSLEASLAGVELRGGLQLTAFCPRPGALLAQAPVAGPAPARSRSLGFALGGAIEQRIHPDPHGSGTWDATTAAALEVHVLDSLAFRLATGAEPPPSPIDARSYTDRGLPWFERYDEAFGDLSASVALQGATTLAEYDARNPGTGDSPPALSDRELHVTPIHPAIHPKRPGNA
jgi:hypothetical protein